MQSPAYDKKTQLRLTMRRLWDDHVDRTRFYILSVLHDLPDQKNAERYLMANQDDIGGAVGSYYGDAAGKQLSSLLKEHIAVGGQIIQAVHTKQMQKIPGLQAAWEKNADTISAFLSAANPAWPYAEMRPMMRSHLALTTDELLARAQGRYADDLAAFDRVVGQIMHMADTLSEGLISQFPQKFT